MCHEAGLKPINFQLVSFERKNFCERKKSFSFRLPILDRFSEERNKEKGIRHWKREEKPINQKLFHAANDARAKHQAEGGEGEGEKDEIPNLVRNIKCSKS